MWTGGEGIGVSESITRVPRLLQLLVRNMVTEAVPNGVMTAFGESTDGKLDH